MSNRPISPTEIALYDKHLACATNADRLRFRRVCDRITALMLDPGSCQYDWCVGLEPFGDRMAAKTRTGAMITLAARNARNRKLNTVVGGSGTLPQTISDGGLLRIALSVVAPELPAFDVKPLKKHLGTLPVAMRINYLLQVAARFPLLRSAGLRAWSNVFALNTLIIAQSGVGFLLALDSGSLERLASLEPSSPCWNSLAKKSRRGADSDDTGAVPTSAGEINIDTILRWLSMPISLRHLAIDALIHGKAEWEAVPLGTMITDQIVSHDAHGCQLWCDSDGLVHVTVAAHGETTNRFACMARYQINDEQLLGPLATPNGPWTYQPTLDPVMLRMVQQFTLRCLAPNGGLAPIQDGGKLDWLIDQSIDRYMQTELEGLNKQRGV